MDKSRLFKPIVIGNIELSHRIGMCPMTRYRASDDHVPVESMIKYYSQRASVPGTLLISEGTFISNVDGGYANVPGIFNQEQIDAWRKVTDAVHEKRSFIFCQLWSLGRAADAAVAKQEGFTVVSSSTLALDRRSAPNQLTVDEIQGRIRNYAEAAKNAIAAGFDGVEIHGANGYLVDQFIQDVCNQRTDEYGGNLEARSRFAVEVVTAVCNAIGPERTGIRFSPWSVYNGMRMTNPIPQFSDVIRKIANLEIAYLHLVESRIAGASDVEASDKLTFAYDLFNRPILVAGGLTPASAQQLLDEEYPQKDIVAMFGRFFISTPDLPFRIQKHLEFTEYDRRTFYTPKSEVGYTDYQFSEDYKARGVSQT